MNNIALTGHKPKLSGQAFGLYYTNATLAGAVGISISAWILKFFSQWYALKIPKLVPLASGLTPINLKYYPADMPSVLHQIFHRGWSALFWFYSLLMLISLILSLWKYRPNIGPAVSCQSN